MRFENLTVQEGSSKYENIGTVTIANQRYYMFDSSVPDDFSEGMKADVQNAACKMGGDAVSLNTSTRGYFQFLVWRAR